MTPPEGLLLGLRLRIARAKARVRHPIHRAVVLHVVGRHGEGLPAQREGAAKERNHEPERLNTGIYNNLKLPPGGASWRLVEAKSDKLSFETALGQLEAIVESMESGDVPLAELLAKFEEGNKLLKLCETRLKDAELKIEQLKKQKDGAAFVPFATEREV